MVWVGAFERIGKAAWGVGTLTLATGAVLIVGYYLFDVHVLPVIDAATIVPLLIAVALVGVFSLAIQIVLGLAPSHFLRAQYFDSERARYSCKGRAMTWRLADALSFFALAFLSLLVLFVPPIARWPHSFCLLAGTLMGSAIAGGFVIRVRHFAYQDLFVVGLLFAYAVILDWSFREGPASGIACFYGAAFTIVALSGWIFLPDLARAKTNASKRMRRLAGAKALTGLGVGALSVIPIVAYVGAGTSSDVPSVVASLAIAIVAIGIANLLFAILPLRMAPYFVLPLAFMMAMSEPQAVVGFPFSALGIGQSWYRLTVQSRSAHETATLEKCFLATPDKAHRDYLEFRSFVLSDLGSNWVLANGRSPGGIREVKAIYARPATCMYQVDRAFIIDAEPMAWPTGAPDWSASRAVSVARGSSALTIAGSSRRTPRRR